MTNPFEPEGGRPDPDLCAIMSERRQLTNLAYRLLGSLAEAEDAAGLIVYRPSSRLKVPSGRQRRCGGRG